MPASKDHYPRSSSRPVKDFSMSAHSMDIDGPRRSESMSMDVTEDAVPCLQPHRHDSLQMNSPSIADRRMSLDFLLPQRRQSSFPLIPSVASRKRKHTNDSLDMQVLPVDHHHIQDDDSFVDSESSQPPRRKRLRQRTRQDGEFSPLLYMSPAHDQNSPAGQEATPASHYLPTITNPLHAIRRSFLQPETFLEHGPRILQSNPTADEDGDHLERGRSDSTNSFAEVALASIPSKPDQTPSRLSTLRDFSLPRPFEDTQTSNSSSSHNILVHERGLDAPPSFFVTRPPSGQRADGGALVSRGPASSDDSKRGDALAHQTMHPLDTSTSTNAIDVFLDKPLCESPESMDSDEQGRAHFEFPVLVVGPEGYVDGPSELCDDI